MSFLKSYQYNDATQEYSMRGVSQTKLVLLGWTNIALSTIGAYTVGKYVGKKIVEAARKR